MSVFLYRAQRALLARMAPESRKEAAFDILHAAISTAFDHIDPNEALAEVRARARLAQAGRRL